MTARRFVLALCAIALVGVGARLLYVHSVVERSEYGLDSTWYFLQAGNIKDGAGFVDPAARIQEGASRPTAAHPPAYPALLAAEIVVAGADDMDSLRWLGTIGGAATIILTGLLGARIGGRAVGLIAAGIVAFDPRLIAVDGSLMTEALFVPIVVGALLCALRVARGGAWPWWLALGVLLGAGILTRPDAVLFAAVLVVPLAIWSAADPRARLVGIGVTALAVAVIVMPWVARNAVQVGEATVATSSGATALAGANCERTYYGDLLGAWDFDCIRPFRPGQDDEAAWSAAIRADATTYARDHLPRLPVVAGARVARSLGLYAPRQEARLEAIESRSYRWQLFTFATSLLLLVVGAYGITRRVPGALVRWILAAPLASGFAIMVLSYANTRLLAFGMPALAVGAACALRAPFAPTSNTAPGSGAGA